MRDEAWSAGKISEAIRAEELRLKAAGLLINKQHVVKEDITAATKEQVTKNLRSSADSRSRRMVGYHTNVDVVNMTHKIQFIWRKALRPLRTPRGEEAETSGFPKNCSGSGPSGSGSGLTSGLGIGVSSGFLPDLPGCQATVVGPLRGSGQTEQLFEVRRFAWVWISLGASRSSNGVPLSNNCSLLRSAPDLRFVPKKKIKKMFFVDQGRNGCYI